MIEVKVSFWVWLISIAVSASAVFILGGAKEPNVELPEISINGCSSMVFIGSSLTASGIRTDAASARSEPHHIESPDNCVLSLPGITERETLLITDHVMTVKPSIIFVEINALATDFRGVRNIPYASNFAERWITLQGQMASSLKTILRLPQDQEASGRIVSTASARLVGQKFDRDALTIYPRTARYLSRFSELIKLAESWGTRVVFFWPPQFAKEDPKTTAQFFRLRAHIVSVCKKLAAQCWLPSERWSERYFYDPLGHFNELGAARLITELTGWSSEL